MPVTTSPGPCRRKVLIVDDHPIVRRGLRELIEDEPDFEVWGEAEEVAEALRLVDDACPDIVVVDLSLKDSHGIDLLEAIKARGVGVKTIVSSMHDELLFAERTVRAGASGYVSKKELPETFIDAMRLVLRGETYLSPRVSSRTPRLRPPNPGAKGDPVRALSNRELAVFELLGRGFSVKHIARRLDLSPKTVETYRENIKVKLKLCNSNELVRQATCWVLENG